MNKKTIIENDKTFIIAEAGVNHNGSLETAKKLIDAAVDADVDAVKFQTFSADRLVTKNAPKADYQNKTTDKNESQYDMLKKLELTYEEHKILKKYCQENDILFMSTPFDFESVDLLEKLGVEIYKVGSSDTNNLPLLKYIAEKDKPIILSTGMSTLTEVSEAVDTISSTGNNDLSLLHCVSNYPAQYENVNLNAMNTMKTAFDLEVGYSDHTPGIEVPIAVVAMGAKVIEKHFTLDKDMEGPDHKASLNPEELKKMVKAIRNIEVALGSSTKKPAPNEKENLKTVRKSLVINKNKEIGEQIFSEDIDIKRPGTGIAPKYKDIIIGMELVKKVKEDQILTWEAFQVE
ncbi:N-acetylneuraminate synthase [Halanaerobium congolense]|uniref:N-acetylneuraminate synthase n=1 Tax=Halanaerobium congolense TaxID=54121 RepID=UPI00105D7F4D|nr:N-acetylneuraminate synthase [Halanaerobium congolense]TDP26384.1 N-acetylneuraminate synthase [Halanaerobium congolense]